MSVHDDQEGIVGGGKFLDEAGEAWATRRAVFLGVLCLERPERHDGVNLWFVNCSWLGEVSGLAMGGPPANCSIVLICVHTAIRVIA